MKIERGFSGLGGFSLRFMGFIGVVQRKSAFYFHIR
jgi:hypothetical protein